MNLDYSRPYHVNESSLVDYFFKVYNWPHESTLRDMIRTYADKIGESTPCYILENPRVDSHNYVCNPHFLDSLRQIFINCFNDIERIYIDV